MGNNYYCLNFPKLVQPCFLSSQKQSDFLKALPQLKIRYIMKINNNTTKIDINSVIDRIENNTSLFSEDYRKLLDIDRIRKIFCNDYPHKEHLLRVCLSLPALISNEEEESVDPAVVAKYTDAIFLIYVIYSYYYDKALDDGKTKLLPTVIVLLKMTFEFCIQEGIDFMDSVKVVEAYNTKPLKIKVGKIHKTSLIEKNKNWYDCRLGFQILYVLIDDFVKKHIKNPKKDWRNLYKYYLIDAQIHDDVQDFTDDYKDGELTSFGIFALEKYIKNKKKINLKNPISATRFQYFILRKTESLYLDFVTRFKSYIDSEPDSITSNDFKEFKHNLEGFASEVIFE